MRGDELEPVRVLISDDHPHFREGLKALLLSAPELEVVGEAADGEEAVRLAARLQPDVALMDLYMPGIGGI
ncbi:MAG: response regulator transcription factor [Gemmatimonadetes bacterium]|jgi:DNA-binding NarL/FixJ family response regulator|nr:response regulator transcription factor [Gemmatimonadota bacterium]